MFGVKKRDVFLMSIRGGPQKKRATGIMSITNNLHKRSKCKICGRRILDAQRVCVDGYTVRDRLVNFFYYHVDCVGRLISIVP